MLFSELGLRDLFSVRGQAISSEDGNTPALRKVLFMVEC